MQSNHSFYFRGDALLKKSQITFFLVIFHISHSSALVPVIISSLSIQTQCIAVILGATVSVWIFYFILQAHRKR